MSDNIAVLPDVEKDDIKVALDIMVRHTQEFLEYHKVYAKLLKHKYDSLIEVGFTDEQVMCIILETGVG